MISPRPIFPSKRDWWITALIWGGVALALSALLPVARSSCSSYETLLGAVVALAATGLMLWVLYGTFYEFYDHLLVIRCGPFRFRVPLDELDSVEPTRNPLSSPACSLDRLLLRYGRRRVMISPADKFGFLAELESRCPGLKRIGC